MTQRGAEFWTSGAVPIIGPEVLISIVGSASDVALVVTPEDRVASVMVNPNANGMSVFERWYGQGFLETLTVESIPKFQERAALLRAGGESRAPLELNHALADGEDVPIQYSVFRMANDRSLLLLGRDLRPIAALQQQLIESQRVLERDYELQREAETKLRVLMESSEQAIVFASLTTGRVINANQLASDLLGVKRDALIDSQLTSHFAGMKNSITERLLQASSDGLERPVDLVIKRNDMMVSAAPIIFRSSGERMLFCRLNLPDKLRVQRSGLSDLLNGMFQNAANGIVFINGSGTIKTANEAFLNLCEAPDLARVSGRSLADYLERGSLDVRLMVENAARSRKLPLFSTRLLTDHQHTVPVEVSVTTVEFGGSEMYAVTMRDLARDSSVAQAATSVREQNARNVSELVGSASLKEILAETIDEVEKMCIRTAVDMTGNNRVAAAEMLGLSRQSLYVKLRKYGLVNRDDS
ncbi:transcriptional regulator PpsR [Phaeobacter sp.]|uniref:transcriptional regulator PpsR n=1 Tax=Phaeobacter sp. TaxID=1902409 RepID=UPI0025E2FBA4|nr:transcriptional regulator PpsR [Phaeobacter sp.]